MILNIRLFEWCFEIASSKMRKRLAKVNSHYAPVLTNNVRCCGKKILKFSGLNEMDDA